MTTFITPADVGDISAAAVDMLLLHRRRSEAIDQYKGALDGERLADNRERPGTPNDSKKTAQVTKGFRENPYLQAH